MITKKMLKIAAVPLKCIKPQTLHENHNEMSQVLAEKKLNYTEGFHYP